jgi:predicted nucleotidyltransferase
MIKTLKRFNINKQITPPTWLLDNIHYLVQMGSVAYGASSDYSDIDVYGLCIPPKEYVFPHTVGYVYGFDSFPNFNQWQEHHIKDVSNQKEYDFSIYNIVKYFRLVTDGNPNMVDSLFVPERCVLHSTSIGTYIRDNKEIFLHKGMWKKFRGYALSQLHKIETKKPKEGSKRDELVKKYGYDTKFAYHLFRLMFEIEEILFSHTLNLDKNGDMLRSIREGMFSLKEVHEWFENKNKTLEEMFVKSTLKEKPDIKKIRIILLSCLEMHYGSLDEMIRITNTKESEILNEIRRLVL